MIKALEIIFIIIIFGGLTGSSYATIHIGLPYISSTILFSTYLICYSLWKICGRICDAMFDATNIRRRCRVCEDTAIQEHNDFVAECAKKWNGTDLNFGVKIEAEKDKAEK